MGDEQPLDSPPQGPSIRIHQTPYSCEVLLLLQELRYDLLNINFGGHTITDPATRFEYTNMTEFITALVDARRDPPSDRELDSLLFTTMHILRLLHYIVHQPSYQLIESKIKQNTSFFGGAPTGAPALQWTALERLINLMDKYSDTMQLNQ
jgi:hypothetical protein